MNHSRLLAGAACAGLALGVAACGDDDNDNGPKLVKKSFIVTERDTNDFGFVDNPPKTKVGKYGPHKMSAGDQLAFRSVLKRAGKTVGELNARCLVIKAGTFETAGGECTGTFTLPEGTLSVSVGGPKIFGGKTTNGAVTGGTRAYAGATGTFTSPNNDTSTTHDTFTIWVPHDED